MGRRRAMWDKKLPDLAIHFFYVVLILVGIIILLATQKWT
jgi:hypothetical protein